MSISGGVFDWIVKLKHGYILRHQTYCQRQLFSKDEHGYESRPGERSKKGPI